jgi:ABC-2 type transport system permease protein
MIYRFIFDCAQLNTLKQLLIRSFIVYKPHFADKTINALIWTVINVVVMEFVMPTVGLRDFGPFTLISTAATNSFFVGANQIAGLVSEIDDKSSNLQYELTLPISQTMIFIKYGLEYAYQGFISSVMIVPIGLVLLYNQYPFEYFHLAKFHFLLILISIFSGFFALWLSNFVGNIFHGLENMWTRIIFPFWFLGGFQFSWKGLHSINPMIAYVNLLNPLTYVHEGARAACLDPKISLNYWTCVGMLTCFTILFGCWGIAGLKKRMDCL